MSAQGPHILFAQVPEFYAAVERAADPTLADRPVVVGGNPRKRGRVQSATADALAVGVEVGMSMLDALERCPSARALRTDMKRYREASGRLRGLLRGQLAALEPAGLDAAYLDSSSDPRSANAIAETLVGRCADELALPMRVGIAGVKFLAAIAARRVAVPGVHCVELGSEAAFLAPLQLSELPGVGPRTLDALRELGATHVRELLAIDSEKLEHALGNHGLRILELARGEDASRVRVAGLPRTLSQEHTFETPQRDLAVLGERMHRLASGLESGLRRQGLLARRVALKLRYADEEISTRSRTLAHAVASAGEIAAVASGLLDRTHAGSRPVSLLGIALSGLGPAGSEDPQLDLFGQSE